MTEAAEGRAQAAPGGPGAQATCPIGQKQALSFRGKTKAWGSLVGPLIVQKGSRGSGRGSPQFTPGP